MTNELEALIAETKEGKARLEATFRELQQQGQALQAQLQRIQADLLATDGALQGLEALRKRLQAKPNPELEVVK